MQGGGVLEHPKHPPKSAPASGKLSRGAWRGKQAPLSAVSPNAITSVAAVKSRAVVIWGKLGGAEAEMILDSGSSVSFIQECLLPQVLGTTRAEVAN